MVGAHILGDVQSASVVIAVAAVRAPHEEAPPRHEGSSVLPKIPVVVPVVMSTVTHVYPTTLSESTLPAALHSGTRNVPLLEAGAL